MYGQGGNMGTGVAINLGGGHQGCHGHAFNRWGNNSNYNQMQGFTHVDYSQGWNANVHDQMLQNNINIVYQKYDSNFSGQLEGQEFFNAYRELCLMMGMAPPQSYQETWQAVNQCDSNRDGRVTKMEMFTLFKRIQGINSGMMMNQGMGMQGGMGGGMGMNQGLGLNINLGF